MHDTPWLSIIGLGEDGPDGLSVASRKALDSAEIIMGPARHLALIGASKAKQIEWPVPFADGIEKLATFRGRSVAVLVSGDPFWYGAGSVFANRFERSEWQAFPTLSIFSLAASRLGWAIEKTLCIGLHAAPLTRLRPHIAHGAKAIVLLRDGDAVSELRAYLAEIGFGHSQFHILEALNGQRENITAVKAIDDLPAQISHPVCVGVEFFGGSEIPKSSGLEDALFDNDGQITKRPIRALTLSALAPKRGEHLLDIGGGSGSISIEWLLSDPTTSATIVEANPDRATRIRENANRLGVDRLKIVVGKAPIVLDGISPSAVFIGGGLSQELLQQLHETLAKGTRLVANAVTLESEALLVEWQSKVGGDLMRVEISSLTSIGPKRAWDAAYPIVQWSVTL